MSPLMCNTASSRQQLHAMDVNSAATTHDKFIHETAQLFESHSELALDPALSEINIQVGCDSVDDYTYLFGPQAYDQTGTS